MVTLLQGSFRGMRKSPGSYLRSLLIIGSCPRAFRKKKNWQKGIADPYLFTCRSILKHKIQIFPQHNKSLWRIYIFHWQI